MPPIEDDPFDQAVTQPNLKLENLINIPCQTIITSSPPVSHFATSEPTILTCPPCTPMNSAAPLTEALPKNTDTSDTRENSNTEVNAQVSHVNQDDTQNLNHQMEVKNLDNACKLDLDVGKRPLRPPVVYGIATSGVQFDLLDPCLKQKKEPPDKF